MGLDVYLYSQAEQAANKAHEDGWENTWNAYHDQVTGALIPGRTKEEYEAAARLVPPYQGVSDKPSELYPDHLFKRNYLRSSYNGGGFNRAVPDMLGREEGGLYWIFEPVIGDNPEPYETLLDEERIPALEEVKVRALRVAQELRDSDPLRAMSVMVMLGDRNHQWNHLPTEEEALAWYREEQVRRKNELENASRTDKEDYSYSTAKGMVFGFTKGMEVLGVTLGANPLASFSAQFPANTVGGQLGVLPEPILIYRMHDEGKLSYIQSAEIIGEFCDEAIALIKADGSCSMHWSG